jgi:hypothetical protein
LDIFEAIKKGVLLPGFLLTVFLIFSRKRGARSMTVQVLGWTLAYGLSYLWIFGKPDFPGRNVYHYLFYLPVGVGGLSLFYGQSLGAARPLFRSIIGSSFVVAVVIWLFLSRYHGDLNYLSLGFLAAVFLFYLLSMEKWKSSVGLSLGLWQVMLSSGVLSLVFMFSGSASLSQMTGIVATLLGVLFGFQAMGWLKILSTSWVEFFGASLMALSLYAVLFLEVSPFLIAATLAPSMILAWLVGYFCFDNTWGFLRFVGFWLVPGLLFQLPVLIYVYLVEGAPY